MASTESIAKLAYQLWIARGQPHGSQDQDWLEAERQLGAAAESQGDRAERGRDPVARPGAVRPTSSSPSGISRNSASGAGRKPRGSTALARKSTGAFTAAVKPAGSAEKLSGSGASRNPPVDETDGAPRSAPQDIGEG